MSNKLIKQHDLTTGDITKGIWSFAVPLMFGNVMQQLYNLVDTWVVGTYLGNGALAAVGSSYTLMTFLTSVIDFGNAFSVFVAQNFGAGDKERIRIGIRKAFGNVAVFCVVISALVFAFAEPLMKIFVTAPDSRDVIAAGVQYLRIEGVFYIGIGILFLLYGYFRAVNKPMMSVVLTVISLGTRVLLAYTLSSVKAIGVVGIWVAIPIGWFLADAVGLMNLHLTPAYHNREKMQERYDELEP